MNEKHRAYCKDEDKKEVVCPREKSAELVGVEFNIEPGDLVLTPHHINGRWRLGVFSHYGNDQFFTIENGSYFFKIAKYTPELKEYINTGRNLPCHVYHVREMEARVL